MDWRDDEQRVQETGNFLDEGALEPEPRRWKSPLAVFFAGLVTLSWAMWFFWQPMGGPAAPAPAPGPAQPPAPAPGSAPAPASAPSASGVISVDSADADMNAAIAEARRTCPEFVSALAAAGADADTFAVKMSAPTRGGDREHFWVSRLVHENGVFRGLVANDLVDVPGLKAHDRISVSESEITDWMYLEGQGADQVIVGGYTIRALRDRATLEEREKMWGAMRFKGE